MIPEDESLYPRDGSEYGIVDDTMQYHDEPLERKEDEAKQSSIQQASYPIMGDIVTWFDEKIASMDSRTEILAFSRAYGYDAEDCGKAFDICRDLLESKLNEFEQFRNER